jgi:hypothetical protein
LPIDFPVSKNAPNFRSLAYGKGGGAKYGPDPNGDLLKIKIIIKEIIMQKHSRKTRTK